MALVSVMCFIMFLGANHSWLEHTHGLAEKINGEYYGTGQTQLLGFVVVDMGGLPRDYSRLHHRLGA